jgi:hypothetical protein
MGTIIAFPADTATRRARDGMGAPGFSGAKVVILPVIRIERHSDDAGGGRGPEEGAAQGASHGRRRRRRVRS